MFNSFQQSKSYIRDCYRWMLFINPVEMSPLRSAFNFCDHYSGFGVSFGGVNEAEEMTIAHAHFSNLLSPCIGRKNSPSCLCLKNHRAVGFENVRPSFKYPGSTGDENELFISSPFCRYFSYLSFDNLAALGNVPSVLYRDTLRLKGETAGNGPLQQARAPELWVCI